jgi:hypothetical protein
MLDGLGLGFGWVGLGVERRAAEATKECAGCSACTMRCEDRRMKESATSPGAWTNRNPLLLVGKYSTSTVQYPPSFIAESSMSSCLVFGF